MSGKIVVHEDEWPLSDTGFAKAPDAGRFAQNVASWFVGEGNKGNFLVATSHWGATQGKLAAAMKEKGHTWTGDYTTPFTLDFAKQYDAVFVGGMSVDNQVLIDYVRDGGNVYLMGGTGSAVTADGEAKRWKSFLNAFGFKFHNVWNGNSGVKDITGTHPIFEGVKKIYINNGNPVIDIDEESEANAVIQSYSTGGSVAIYDASRDAPVVTINSILYVGNANRHADEFIEIVNSGAAHTDISGWKIHAGNRNNKDFVFPEGAIIKAGQTIRVYTNQVHEESGGYSFGWKKQVWGMDPHGGTGYLYDASGTEVSALGYGEFAADNTDTGKMVTHN